MELLCAERVSPGSSERRVAGAGAPAAAAPDPVLLRRRVLHNLLRTEERYAITANYFGTVQTEITPHIRRQVAEWMLEVCEDQNCHEEVFPLAISYLDRFLSICRVGKSQMQLLGTTCLLLASKLREPSSRGLPADLLVFYTANSITLSDLCRNDPKPIKRAATECMDDRIKKSKLDTADPFIDSSWDVETVAACMECEQKDLLVSWELLVLSKLKWDVAGVTAHAFLPLLLARLPLRDVVDVDMVQRHAQYFIALAARDYEFTLHSASTLASCSIAAALRGLGLDGHLERLHELTGTDLDCLQTCLEQIEQMVQGMIDERAVVVPNGPPREAGWTPPPTQDKAHSNAATPTDVRDVQF